MKKLLRLTARFYRTIPLNQQGLEEETVKLDPRKTALVGMHCWNIGCPDGPAVDDDYYVGMGLRETTEEAGRIMRERMLPAMEAARAAGVLVAHVENDSIGNKHRDLMEIPPTVSHTKTEGETPPPAAPGYRQKICDRAHGPAYDTRSPYASMDRASLLMPRKGEPFAIDSLQLHRMLSPRGIENLVYTGFATDMCVLRSPGGVIEMSCWFSYRVFIMREATIGVEYRDWFDARTSTNYGIRGVESHYGHSISWDEWMRECKALARKGPRA